jgi:CheY-like chemotaxis protein
MYKLPKVTLVLEPNIEKGSIFNGALESSGYIVKVVHNEREFFETCLELVPDIVVINSTHKDVNEELICKKIRRHSFLKEIAIILLVPKINFSTTPKIEKLKLDALEEYPLQNKNFLQTIKKVSKKFFIPEAALIEKNEITGNMHIDLLEISETSFNFSAPVKLNSQAHVEINSSLLDQFGIIDKNFEADINGNYFESKLYKNEVGFRGISVKVLKEIKSYCNKQKERKS